MPDIFDEVESDLRAERAREFLQRYGILLIALAVLIVAGTGAWKYWQHRQLQSDAAVAAIFLAADQDAKPTPGGIPPDKLKAALAGYQRVVAEGDEGYRTLARLRMAALEAGNGDLKAADSLWDQVAGDTKADQLFRDLATLQWGMHQPDSTPADTIRARIGPIADPTNPWRPMAQEQLALLDIRTGKTDEARKTLKGLADDITAPQGVRARAAALLQRLED